MRKYARCSYDPTDRGELFFGRIFQKEVCLYVVDTCVKLKSGSNL